VGGREGGVPKMALQGIPRAEGEGWLVGSGALVQGRENPVDFLLA